MASVSSEIGPKAAAAVSALVSTIVTAATASASEAVRVAASSPSTTPTSVAATAAPWLSPLKSAAAAGSGIESTGRGSDGYVVKNAAAGLDSPRGGVQRGENVAGAGRNRMLEPLVSRGSKNFIKDGEEEKGGQPRGTARVVYSRGPADGEAVWVAGRRESAAVKVRPSAPYLYVAVLQASQTSYKPPSYTSLLQH